MQDALNGGLIAPALPGGRAGADLHLAPEDGYLVARVDERSGAEEPVEVRLPLEGASLEAGGASGRMLFLRHPALDGVTLYTEDRALIGAIRGARDWGDLGSVFARIEREHRGARLAIPVWIAALALGAYLLFRSLDLLIGLVPIEVDRQLGAFAEPQLVSQAGGPVMNDPTVTRPVRAVMDRVVAASPMPDLDVKLTVVDAPAVNAFALPGGYIVVFSGLLRDAERPEELAAVLAHELGHVTERHGLRRLARSAGIVLVVDAVLGDVAGMLGAAREFFTLAAVNDYSRAQEDAADAVGVRTLHAAGIDPTASRTFFERLAREADGLLDQEVLSWISTHPSHAERVKSIDAQITALGPTEVRPIEVDWTAMKTALGEP
jgi:Zn-dependent protease with chaperone function